MSDSVRLHRWQPNRLPRRWDSPGKNTGVGCHFLLQCRKMKSESEVALSCPTLSDPMDCSLPGSSVHGIFQARVLEWGAIAFSASLPQIPLDLMTKILPKKYKLVKQYHKNTVQGLGIFTEKIDSALCLCKLGLICSHKVEFALPWVHCLEIR